MFDDVEIVRSETDKVRVYVDGNHEYFAGDKVTVSGLSTSLSGIPEFMKLKLIAHT